MTDWSVYAGRWITLDESHRVVGVGQIPEEAERAGRQARPKEQLELCRVAGHPPYLLLPAWPFLPLGALLAAAPTWLAGGAVRDLLLGRPLHDWDFTTAGDARRLARACANTLRGAYMELDAERDTGRAIVTDPKRREPITLDFAALRGTTIEEDLRHRDFTINAMALTLDGELLDPTGGQADLAARCVRVTHTGAFADDPARLLRAPRNCGTLGFTLDPQTAQLIRASAATITAVAPERIRAELLRLIALEPTAPTLALTHSLGLLRHVLPEAAALADVEQTWPHHYTSAWEHTLATLTALEGLTALLQGRPHPKLRVGHIAAPSWAWEAARRRLTPLVTPLLEYLHTPTTTELTRGALVKWGALLHDTGKPSTRTVSDDGRTHFYGHAESGARLVYARLSNLHFPNKARDFVVILIGEHMRLITLAQTTPLSRRSSYRFFRATGDAGVGVLLLALADALAVWGPRLEASRWERLLEIARTLLEHYFHNQEEIINPPPLLTGHDLLALDFAPGPRLGQVLASLREAQAAGDVHTRDEALVFVKNFQ